MSWSMDSIAGVRRTFAAGVMLLHGFLTFLASLVAMRVASLFTSLAKLPFVSFFALFIALLSGALSACFYQQPMSAQHDILHKAAPMAPSATQAPINPLLAFLSISVAAFFILSPFGGSKAQAYSLYGYEDEYGIIHLLDQQENDQYVLLYEGEKRPKMSLETIRSLIRKKGGATADQKKEWIKENVTAWKPRPVSLAPITPPKELVQTVKKIATRHTMDPNLLLAVIAQESGFHTRAISPKGAQGLMQLMPETQRIYGLDDPFDANGNIDAGARYLRQLMGRFQTLSLALAAYNAGPEAVAKYNGIPPYQETQQYVKNVLARYELLKAGGR